MSYEKTKLMNLEDGQTLLGAIDGKMSDLKSAIGDTDDIICDGKIISSKFINGVRDSSGDINVVIANTKRCTTDRVWSLNKGDTISISNMASGTQSIITGKYSNGTYISGWKTEDFSFEIVNDGLYAVIASKNPNTQTVSPSDITTIVTIVDYSSRIAKNENNIKTIKISEYKPFMKRTGGVSLNAVGIGDAVDLSPLDTTGSHWTVLISDVNPKEKFNIYAIDGNVSRPWAFLDAEKKLLSKAYDAYAENVEIIAPDNTKYLLVQVGTAIETYYQNAYITRQESFAFLLNGKRIGIEQLNNPVDVENLFVNATCIAPNDNATPKNRQDMFSLLHFSDIHGDAVDIERILVFNGLYSKYIYDILHTGDSPNNYFGDTNPFSLIGGAQILNVVGNHDCWIQGANPPYSATSAQVYEKFFSPFISYWAVTSAGENLCYYYKDYATARVRMIVLDCMHYDTTQETWFASVLASVPSGYRVVAVTHYASETGLTNIDCTFTPYNASLNPSTSERMPESAFSAVDTFIANGGEFVCWLSGHTHVDFIGTVNGHSNQIQIVISTANPAKNLSQSARVNETKSQDLFNLFVVDGTNKLLKLIRIGADTDKMMRSKKTLCVNYETKQVISNT